MIHYHGTPVSGKRKDVVQFLAGRHALVPFPRKDDLGAVAEVCQSFVFDNGAFTFWKQGGNLDVDGYLRWVDDWYRHPGFDWALIPDVIDGDEDANDRLLEQWPSHMPGVPVWHLHESLERLQWLAKTWRIVAIGSSGEWRTPGTALWWLRINDALRSICDIHGRPLCKLHGLRMLNPKVFGKMPLASADSTNATVNAGSVNRFGMYTPPTAGQRAEVIASRIESVNSSAIWEPFMEPDGMIYLTPFDPATLLCTGPSTDSGFESLQAAADAMGPPEQRLRRMVVYPGFCFTDYPLHLQKVDAAVTMAATAPELSKPHGL